MNQVQSILSRVESSPMTSLIVFMSWQAPRHESTLHCASFETFVSLAKSRLQSDFTAHKLNGVYGGVAEESCMMQFDNINQLDALNLIEDAILLGKDLGQDSILTSSVKSSRLYSCQSGHVDAVGQGYQLLENPADNYSELNGVKFSLNLEF